MQKSKASEAFFMDPLYDYTGGKLELMRQVSKSVREHIDRVKPNYEVRMNTQFYEALPGDQTQKTAVMLDALRDLSSRVSMTTLYLPHMYLSGSEQVLAAVVRQQQENLTLVDLNNNSFDAGMPAVLGAALAQCTSLTRVAMSSCGMSESVIAELMPHLSRCTKLTHLNLANNTLRRIGSQGVASALASLPRLMHVNLAGNVIGDAGAILLAEALPRCTELRHLDLCSNSINSAGCERLATALLQCPALAELHLSSNHIGNEGCEALTDMRKARPRTSMHVDVRRNGVGIHAMLDARAVGILSFDYAIVNVPQAPAAPMDWGGHGATDAALCVEASGLWDAQLRAMKSLLDCDAHDIGH
jgi:hypothetical protein